jgi:DNA-binding NarL/FixJ family response regulator
MIELILAAGSPIFLEELEGALITQTNWNILGTANNKETLLSLLEMNIPELLNMEVRFVEEKGFESAKVVRDQYPDIKIIFLTQYEHHALVKQSISLGVKAYLLKNLSAQELVSAIEMAHRGETDFFYKKGKVN